MTYVISACLFRLVLPLLLFTCVVFRPSALSGVYLVAALISAFLPVPTNRTMKGCTGIYLKILLGVSLITLLMGLAFQIYLLASGPYGEVLTDNKDLESVLRYCGFVRLDKADYVTIITWISPELLAFITTIVVFVLARRLSVGEELIETETGEDSRSKMKSQEASYLVSIGKYAILFLLCVSAALRPSVQGGLYFLVFICSATWLSCSKNLARGFAFVIRLLLIVIIAHIVSLYTLQIQYFQELLSDNSQYQRYFALTIFYTIDESADPRQFIASSQEWDAILNPVVLVLLFFVTAMVAKEDAKPKDSTGSDTLAGGDQLASDIDGAHLDEEEKVSCLENFIFLLEQFLQFVVKVSYIATNIIMMTWSITYHSWLTFVLLIWANILWIIPNQRKSMLKCSPFLVFYAIFLLLSGYIYSMDLTEAELPSQLADVNLAQIGFIKILEFPCKHLLAKSAFTIMFWFTLRQYTTELKQAKQRKSLADMAAPLQVSVSAAAGIPPEHAKHSKVLQKIGEYLSKVFVRFWIWVVAIILFVVAITGERMTVFRILYMALFLFFILTFQLSFNFWRKMMFAFLLIVIIYSMLILILVYTYQFDNFSTYWTEYLHVPLEQQLDIGLETYKTTQLFVRLATPTCFIIVTAIQLHYFHKDFLHLTDESAQHAQAGRMTSLANSSMPETTSERRESDVTDAKLEVTDTETIPTKKDNTPYKYFTQKCQEVLNLICLYLEIQMHRAVLLIGAFMCIYDKCALYSVVIPLLVIGLIIGRKLSLAIIKVISIFTAVKLLAQMVYQVQYIHHNWSNTTCDISTNNYTVNNAEWFGFYKSSHMASIVSWNIVYLTIATLYSVVLIRQHNYRIAMGLSMIRPFFLFPNARRFDAEKGVLPAFKFLCNHGYYKFGYEISLMATVGLIGMRMDLYALCYTVWLCILCFLKRDVLRAGMWTLFLFFIAITIPIQYVLSVGLLPSLCIDFPWDDTPLLRRLQEWAFLMDTVNPPNVKRLVCDFILLLFVARQRVVFRIEQRFKNREYPGGSNDSIVHLAETDDFVNPVPDYITYARTYLDVIKRLALLSFMWITLAMLFLAGANRVNIYAVGYLLGSFVFLWQGTELYLKPLPTILRSWNILLCYSVLVIFLKTTSQFVGCVLIGEATPDLCWVIQLLGIGCLNKFDKTGKPMSTQDCYIPRDSLGIAWDGICFAFLIMQKRLFCSYNFFHIVDETKASTILASRGADLIEVLRERRMQEQAEHEKLVLEKIKVKMDRIKATQEKIQGPNYQEVNNHYIAIRSGDYYMFDELDDDEDLDIVEHTKQPLDDEDEKERGVNIGRLLSNTLKSDISTVVRKDRLQRRASIPAERRLSSKSTRSQAHSAPPVIEESPQRRKRSWSSKKEPKAGPSTEPDDYGDSYDQTLPQTRCQSFLDYLIYIWKLIESLMVSIIRALNKHSRDFRYVRRVLVQEKKILKETTNYTKGVRLGKNKVWQPASSYQALLQTRAEIIEFEEEGELSQYDQPTVVRLLIAIWYIIISNSAILCYVMIFLNQMKSATFMSLPLPLLVFIWGTLTIPRPTKSFWVTIIAYTQIIVLIKCIFQFEFWPWNQPSAITNTSPYYPPRILGIEQNQYYAVWDLLLLLVIYFHRFLLKSVGLWTSVFITVPVLNDGTYAVQEIKKKSTLLHRDGQLRHPNLYAKRRGIILKPKRRKMCFRPVQLNEDNMPLDSEDTIHVSVKTDYAEPVDLFPETIQMSTLKYSESIKEFIRQLRDPTSRASADVYSYMFLCDFFNFFVILIGYTSFGEQQSDEGGVSSYLQDNRVPHLFLLMLILQFLLIIVDRAIFLRKNITAKIVFQYIQIIMLHCWLFILFPIITDRYFNSVIPPQMYYMVKCFYLLLSAYQIRCGYPSKILGNFLCKSYNYVNKFLFQGFMLVPFLFELRTVMDWMWTDTSMTVFDWIKMEDIFATIFQIKCIRRAETDYPQPRGEKKASTVKYIMGGFLLFTIVAIIWFPLVFFSLGNAVGQPNVPYDVTLTIRIGPYEPVYHITAQANSIFNFTERDYGILEDTYKKNKIALNFIKNYQAADIAAVKLSGESSTVWTISPPDKERMIEEVESSNLLQIHLQYKISHKSGNKEDTGLITENVDVMMPAMIDGKPNMERQKLLQFLWGNETSIPPVNLGYILPKFIKVTNRGIALPVTQLMDEQDDPKQSYLRSLNLTLSHSEKQSTEQNTEWWTIQENCSDVNYKVYLRKLSYGDCSSIVLYTFNDRIFPATLSIITAGGIIGLYVLYFFLAFRLIRGNLTGGTINRSWYNDAPNLNRVMILLKNIRIARAMRMYDLEEYLFAKLLFSVRSSTVWVKITRLEGYQRLPQTSTNAPVDRSLTDR